MISAADPTLHRRGFGEFLKYELLTGGPDPHMDMIVAMAQSQSLAEQWWRVGCYVAVYNVASAEAIWAQWPAERLRAAPGQLEAWLAEHWAGLRLRPERKAVRAPVRLAECLRGYETLTREWITKGTLAAADYDACWEQAHRVPYFGRYAATKMLEALRRLGHVTSAIPDLRPAGGGGWSPRLGLAMLCPEHHAVLVDGGDNPMTVAAVNAIADAERSCWGVSHFVFEVLLCEYKECYLTRRQYPGKSHDSELNYWRAIEDYWHGSYASSLLVTRRALFPAWALGELSGWVPPRKELGCAWRDYGYMWSDSLYDYPAMPGVAMPVRKNPIMKHFRPLPWHAVTPRLYIMGHPRRRAPEEWLAAFQRAQVSVVVCLCRRIDDGLLAATRLVGLEYRHRNLPDGQRVPAVVEIVADEVVQVLRTNRGVCLHCEGGRNRSGLIAALVLQRLGIAPEAAVQQVRAARPGALANEEFVRYVLVGARPMEGRLL